MRLKNSKHAKIVDMLELSHKISLTRILAK